MLYSTIFISLLIFELLYFKIADRFNIIDKPNERSSHTDITIRGGGIIFYAGALVWFIISDFTYPYFFIGLTLFASISFLDDILTLSSLIRLPVQFIATLLVLFEVFGFDNWLFLGLGLVLYTGIVNAYNFMDGINGITGLYSLISVISLFIINRQIDFIETDLLIYVGLALLVFTLFNFRNKAKCFAGDVGSVSIAVIIVFTIFKLIFFSQNLWYILLLAVYGVDSILTIVHRLLKKENILKAHRSHLYQVLVKPGPFSHLQIATIYGILQLIINLIVIGFQDLSLMLSIIISGGVLLLLTIAYILIKKFYIKKYNLV